MNNRLDSLLKRLPSHFAKNKESNNYKLLSLIAMGSDESRTVYNTMLKYWDVDQSEGVGLDRLGKDEGILRGGWDDEEYRKMIKIQCILNLSEGDIPTMNLILEAYLGESFLGFEEGWVDYRQPATLVLETKPSELPYPFDLAEKIKAAGVGVIHVETVNPGKPLVFQGTTCLSGEITTIYPYYANTPIEVEVKYNQSSYQQDVETITLFMKGD